MVPMKELKKKKAQASGRLKEKPSETVSSNGMAWEHWKEKPMR
jgi:hypothetical protein